MTMSRRWLAVLGMAGFLLSCGNETPVPQVCPSAITPAAPAVVTPTPQATPASSKKTAKPKTTKPKPGASVKPAADPADPGSSSTPAVSKPAEQDAMALLEEVKTQTLSTSGMRGVITGYECKLDKSMANTYKYKIWVQDKSYRLENIAHTRTNNVGAKVVYHYGDSNARVKPAGFLSLVTVTLDLKDSNLIMVNGYTLDSILSHGVLERVTNGEYAASVYGTTKVGDDKVTIVKLTHKSGPNPLLSAVDYELVGFDERKIYRMWSMYARPEFGLAQNGLVQQILVNEAETGVTIPPDTFKL